MPAQPTFALYDRILDGGLAPLLRGWRAEGLSYEEMAYRLRPEVTVSRSTVARWCIELGIEAS